MPKPSRRHRDDLDPAAVTAYVRTLADLLHLRDWDITVDVRPGTIDACADINCFPSQKRAVIRVGAEFVEADQLDGEARAMWQRHTLVHELIHCHLAGARNLTEDLCSIAFPKGKAAAAVFAGVDSHLEYATDGLSDAVTVFMPLPDWDTSRPAACTRAPARSRRTTTSPTTPVTTPTSTSTPTKETL